MRILVACTLVSLVHCVEYLNVEVAYGYFDHKGLPVEMESLPIMSVDVINDPPQQMPKRGDLVKPSNFDPIELIALLGAGGEGVVFMGFSRSANQKYAVKFNVAPATRDDMITIGKEFQLMYQLSAAHPGFFPKVFFLSKENWIWHKEQETYIRFMVAEAFDSSLFKFLREGKVRATQTQAAMLGYRMIDVLERLHKSGFVHGDVHGDNILIKLESNLAVLGDYGYSSEYQLVNGQHVPYEQVMYEEHGRNLRPLSVFELDFSSKKSRREDIYRLTEMLARFMDLRAVETFLKPHGSSRVEMLRVKKALTFSQMMGTKVHKNFQEMLEYSRGLSFEQTPNYDYLRGLMGGILAENKAVYEGYISLPV